MAKKKNDAFDPTDPKWGGTMKDVRDRIVNDDSDPGAYPFDGTPAPPKDPIASKFVDCLTKLYIKSKGK